MNSLHFFICKAFGGFSDPEVLYHTYLTPLILLPTLILSQIVCHDLAMQAIFEVSYCATTIFWQHHTYIHGKIGILVVEGNYLR